MSTNPRLLRWARRNLRAFEKSAERNPWIHEYRRVAAEVERTGDQSLFADYQRRFLQAQALLYPPETHTKG